VRLVWREALPPAALLAVVAVVAGWFYPWLAVLPALLLAFTLWFFRDPERRTPQDPAALISPADGRVIRVEATKISIFLNVFDVHVCRTPIAGRVESVVHTRGRFLAAFKDEASEQNERATLEVAGRDHRIRFTLVAGLVARRILTWVTEGRNLAAGERIGLIRFGSRVDIDLPADTMPGVAVGDRVVAGETVIARLPRTATADSWRGEGNSGIVRNGQEKDRETIEIGKDHG
jgi:phosphatidylserine decarboxylase